MEMVKCPGCGEENPAKFRLCGYCGTPLAQAAVPLPAHEVRKTVTLLFTDLKDSTALGERLDSEALHEVKERFFGAMAAEITRHGGKVEKYIGDAIMAVFGLPRAHEDDALRAVRAAAGMQQVLKRVNDDLKARFGVELKNRTGVNTGEVVATDDPARDQKLATGDAVNVTARLEAAAPANEILIGEVTYRLVRDAVQAEPVEPLELKGKSQRVRAFRLLAVRGDDGNGRRHDAPVVGRTEEFASLGAAWEAAVSERRARLVTLVGDAGVGKTRLVREMMDRLAERGARCIAGRCLPYGDGITFWPLWGMVHSACGIHPNDTPDEARAKILACVRDGDVADRLASAIGLSPTAFTVQDITWGARRFLRALAADAPVVALFDDIHWAEPTFLQLMEDLLEAVDDAPVLMLATARHELLEARPSWGEFERAQRLALRPLGDEAVAQVVVNLLGGAGLPGDFIRRVVAAAEGNPLYVEQMLSMLSESGALRKEDGRWVAIDLDGDIAVPPTIQALLEARLDNLDRGERATAEPAAVIGLEFPQPAVEALAPARLRDSIGTRLQALARKHFIRPAGGGDGDARYRFEHHLVRDTVYNGLLKRARATMHAEFVKWADAFNAGSDRGREFEEILGYHLEQAYRYLAELGPIDEAGAAIGKDGARRLGSAARRALARGDMHAAANLFRRAAALLETVDSQRARMLPLLAETLMGLGDFRGARAAAREAAELAELLCDRRLGAVSKLVSAFASLYSGELDTRDIDPLETAQSVIPLLESEGADLELASAWRLVVIMHARSGRYSEASVAAEKAMAHARAAQDDRLVAKVGGYFADFALLGSMPVTQAVASCEDLIRQGLIDRQVEGKVLCDLAQLRAMNGELEVARALCTSGRAMLRELGEGIVSASAGIDRALVELMGGDLAAAEAEVKKDFEFLVKAGERFYSSTMAALLSQLVRDQGRDEEALHLSKLAESGAAPDDFDSQSLWRAIRAPILARAGDFAGAEAMARLAVEHVRQSESPVMHADALFELATVLQLCGKLAEALETMGESLSLHKAKGNGTGVARCEKWIAEWKKKGPAVADPAQATGPQN